MFIVTNYIICLWTLTKIHFWVLALYSWYITFYHCTGMEWCCVTDPQMTKISNKLLCHQKLPLQVYNTQVRCLCIHNDTIKCDISQQIHRGIWVAQLVKCLPFAQVMILESWDQPPCSAQWKVCFASRPPSSFPSFSPSLPPPLLLSLLVLSSLFQMNKSNLKKKRITGHEKQISDKVSTSKKDNEHYLNDRPCHHFVW